jgi:hypothetical protein
VSSHGSVAERQAQEAAAAYAARILQLGVAPDDGIALVAAALRSRAGTPPLG